MLKFNKKNKILLLASFLLTICSVVFLCVSINVSISPIFYETNYVHSKTVEFGGKPYNQKYVIKFSKNGTAIVNDDKCFYIVAEDTMFSDADHNIYIIKPRATSETTANFSSTYIQVYNKTKLVYNGTTFKASFNPLILYWIIFSICILLDLSLIFIFLKTNFSKDKNNQSLYNES